MANPSSSNISNEQRRIDFFQDIADEGEQADVYKIAKKNAIANPDGVLTELAGIVGADIRNNRPTFPAQTLEYYNRGLPENGDLLSVEDINQLQWLIDRYGVRLMKQHAPHDYSKLEETFGSTNNPNQQYQYPQSQQQQYPQQQQQQQGVVLPQADPRSEADAMLLRSFLVSNYNPRPHLIETFIENMFRPHYDSFIQNPGALLAMLTHNFASAGKIAYDMWIANRQKVNMDPYSSQQAYYAGTQPPSMMANSMPMQATLNPYVQQQQQQQTPKSQDDLLEEQKWARIEKMMERNMRMRAMEMMNNASGSNNNTAQPPAGTAYIQEPVMDAHGRPTGLYRNIPTPIQGNGDNEAMKTLLQVLQTQNTTLLQNQMQPNSFLEKIATSVLSSHQANNLDPFTAFSKMLEVSNQLNQNKSVDTKPLEVISKEMDAKLALRQLDLQERKEEREFKREIDGEHNATENTRMYIDSIKDVVSKGIQPFVGSITQGMLQGQGQGQGQQPQIQAQQAQVQAQQAAGQATQEEMMAAQQAQIQAEEMRRQQALQQAHLLQQEQKLREAQAQAQRRPVSEVVAERTDGQLDQDYAELEAQSRHLEKIRQQVSAERAKRRMIRSGGISTRAPQQQVFATPPNPAGSGSAYEQSFEERIAAGERAAAEEQEFTGDNIAAGHSYEDNTRGTAGAVSTQMNYDDQEALRASKDGGQVQPMNFSVGGSVNAERGRESDSSTEQLDEEEGEGEGESEGGEYDEPEAEEGTPKPKEE